MRLFTVLLSLGFLWVIVSCRTIGPEPKMSLEQAREVVLQMQSVPMEPPPRKMDDILAILESGRGTGTDHVDSLIRRADVAPPDRQSPKDLYQFYKSRANARYELSRLNDCRGDIRTAIAYDKAAGVGDGTLKQRLAELEMLAGRYESALRLSLEAASIQKITKWRLGPYRAFQSRIHQRMGNFSLAERTIGMAKAAYKQVPAAARLSLIVDGGDLDMGNENDILAAESEMIEAQGRHDQAHSLRASVFNYCYSKRKRKPLGSVRAQMALAANLMGQGRLILAEKAAREAVMDAVGVSGKRSGITADAVQSLGEIILAKGDLNNAQILSNTQIDILTHLGLSMEEDIMVRARLFAARVMVIREKFPEAMASFDLALKGMADNPYFIKRYAYRNHGLILALIQNSRVAEAENLIGQTRNANLKIGRAMVSDETYMQALEAVVLYEKQQTDKALKRFSASFPGLIAIIQNPNSAFEKRHLADILLRVYMDMLIDLYHRDGHRAYGMDMVGEIFRIAEAQHSKVTSALGESVARAASLTDPALAELVRQEQDAGKKIKSLQAVLYNASAAGDDASSRSMVSLERDIQSLSKARTAMATRIGKEFPRYSNYLQPIPPSIAQVQANLARGEALIAIWTLAHKTCVWAIPREGKPAFAVIELGEQAVREKIIALRKALSPNARRLSEIPEFDLAIAYELFDRLLRPVATGWQKATDLLVAIKGPLDQIPLSVLPTEPTKRQSEAGIRFNFYRNVPWLIRKASVTRLPSASALLTLRALPHGHSDREAFAGFGDPLFNQAQIEPRATGHQRLASRGAGSEKISVRGIRVSDLGHLDSTSLASVGIGDLCRLPDTAAEITGIATSLGADPERDVFLGKAASETRVKTEDLSRKKILAFATHALRPGDLDGLAQPAIAFSSPEVTHQDEDGLLTVGEILTLKLNADLVVLSACDTGAGANSDSEAISGLGLAFFYSGARAMLVTMWPVETTSANKLTTELFRFLQTDESLTKTQAHRKSMLKLMDDPGLKNDASGKIVASYAHPFFWAPFVMVGEGGRPAP
ncbi:MAG: CHAT domain-containing protein [Desulfobacterales bacterium]|nr:CHAT domain-containing protein [Desulfobacterales bacterium]